MFNIQAQNDFNYNNSLSTINKDIPKLIIWDFDGTIVHSGDSDRHALKTILAKNPELKGGVDVFWLTEGLPIMKRLELAWPGKSEELLTAFIYDGLPKIFPGIINILEKIKTLAIRQALVSSRSHTTLDKTLKSLNINDLFDLITGLEDVTKEKPSPEGLLHTCDFFKISPADTLYIGDTVLDIEAGRHAGIKTLMADWKHYINQNPTTGAILADPREVLLAL